MYLIWVEWSNLDSVLSVKRFRYTLTETILPLVDTSVFFLFAVIRGWIESGTTDFLFWNLPAIKTPFPWQPILSYVRIRQMDTTNTLRISIPKQLKNGKYMTGWVLNVRQCIALTPGAGEVHSLSGVLIRVTRQSCPRGALRVTSSHFLVLFADMWCFFPGVLYSIISIKVHSIEFRWNSRPKDSPKVVLFVLFDSIYCNCSSGNYNTMSSVPSSFTRSLNDRQRESPPITQALPGNLCAGLRYIHVFGIHAFLLPNEITSTATFHHAWKCDSKTTNESR
jgi:hypothetical protein